MRYSGTWSDPGDLLARTLPGDRVDGYLMSCFELSVRELLRGHGLPYLECMVQPVTSYFRVDVYFRPWVTSEAEYFFDEPRFNGGVTGAWNWISSTSALIDCLTQTLTSGRVVILRSPEHWYGTHPVFLTTHHTSLVTCLEGNHFRFHDFDVDSGRARWRHVDELSISSDFPVAIWNYQVGSALPDRDRLLRALLERSWDHFTEPAAWKVTAQGHGVIEILGHLCSTENVRTMESVHFRAIRRVFLPESIRRWLCGNRRMFAAFLDTCTNYDSIEVMQSELCGSIAAWEDFADALSRSVSSDVDTTQRALDALRAAERRLLAAIDRSRREVCTMDGS